MTRRPRPPTQVEQLDARGRLSVGSCWLRRERHGPHPVAEDHFLLARDLFEAKGQPHEAAAAWEAAIACDSAVAARCHSRADESRTAGHLIAARYFYLQAATLYRRAGFEHEARAMEASEAGCSLESLPDPPLADGEIDALHELREDYKAARRYPEAAALYEIQAVCAEREGNIGKAAAMLTCALDLESTPDRHAWLADLHERLGRAEWAQRHRDSAMRIETRLRPGG